MMALDESQNQRDARCEKLWRKLDPDGTGELDLKGLKAAFRRIDHPMKNADDMLKNIVQKLDKNKDGKIQYDEFRSFLAHAEGQLLALFHDIDHDKNGRLDRQELEQAFRIAHLSVPSRKLHDFFDRMDANNDGYISFEEWRDFLMFMPVHQDGSLHAVMSFYTSMVTVTAEGDSLVSDDRLSHTGRRILSSLFGAVLAIVPRSVSSASSSSSSSPSSSSPSLAMALSGEGDLSTATSLPPSFVSLSPSSSSPIPILAASPTLVSSPGLAESTSAPLFSNGQIYTGLAAGGDGIDGVDGAVNGTATFESDTAAADTMSGAHTEHDSKKTKGKGLSAFVPDPGYFVAGAAAGGVSRTATAPLDRLKVYLLVNTQTAVGGAAKSTAVETAASAAKQGRLLVAARASFNPIVHAVKDIYASGGMRNFFAGNGLNVVKIMPETAIKFGTYEAAKRALANLEGHGDTRDINPYSKFAAGGIAGMVAQFSVYPLDTLKFRLQCETVKDGLKGNQLLIATARRMAAEGFSRTAYRGVTMGLIGMFPYSAIDMWTFDFLKGLYARQAARWTGRHEEDSRPGNLATGMIGATSGAFGATVVYPLNVVRTRLQTQGTRMHRATYTGIADATRKTIQNEGVRGLYKGLTPNLLKVAPALSITWVVYENAKKALDLD